jgi:hypothetical protein
LLAPDSWRIMPSVKLNFINCDSLKQKAGGEMKKIILLAILLFGLTVTLQAEDVKPAFSIRAETDKTEYTAGDAINLTITIKNNGQAAVKIFNPEYPGVSELRVINAESIVAIPQLNPAGGNKVEQIWELKPMEERKFVYKNLSYQSADGVYEFVSSGAKLKPSVYRLFLTIQSPPSQLPSEQIPADVWQGQTAANLVIFKIFAKGEKTLSCPHCSENEWGKAEVTGK